jgi:hypothetical protein
VAGTIYSESKPGLPVRSLPSLRPTCTPHAFLLHRQSHSFKEYALAAILQHGRVLCTRVHRRTDEVLTLTELCAQDAQDAQDAQGAEAGLLQDITALMKEGGGDLGCLGARGGRCHLGVAVAWVVRRGDHWSRVEVYRWMDGWIRLDRYIER